MIVPAASSRARFDAAVARRKPRSEVNLLAVVGDWARRPLDVRLRNRDLAGKPLLLLEDIISDASSV